jgi:hypothetical protein
MKTDYTPHKLKMFIRYSAGLPQSFASAGVLGDLTLIFRTTKFFDALKVDIGLQGKKRGMYSAKS